MKPNRAKLLVVDDSVSMRNIICELIQSLGFTTLDEAPNGAVALEMFLRTPYDVVITDWQMPRASGLDLLRAIRGHAERWDTPVLVLTGDVTHERETEAIAAGASGFVAKPFVVPSLTHSLRRLMDDLAAPANEVPSRARRAAEAVAGAAPR